MQCRFYFYIAIAEELRGLAVESNVPIISATQTTRTGYTSTDMDLKTLQKVLVACNDLMFTNLDRGTRRPQSIVAKQLKNRYNDPTMNKRFYWE